MELAGFHDFPVRLITNIFVSISKRFRILTHHFLNSTRRKKSIAMSTAVESHQNSTNYRISSLFSLISSDSYNLKILCSFGYVMVVDFSLIVKHLRDGLGHRA